MTSCNYVPFEVNDIDLPNPYLDELFDLDLLCTEEGIFINIHEE